MSSKISRLLHQTYWNIFLSWNSYQSFPYPIWICSHQILGYIEESICERFLISISIISPCFRSKTHRDCRLYHSSWELRFLGSCCLCSGEVSRSQIQNYPYKDIIEITILFHNNICILCKIFSSISEIWK